MHEGPGKINETKRSKESDRKFTALLESAPDSMVITDNDGKIAMINKQTEKLFGYCRDEIIGQEIEILIPENFHARHRKERKQYQEHPHTRPMGVGLELFGRRKDGTFFPVEVSLSPLHGEAHEKSQIIAAIRDVSRQKLAQAELAKRTRELEAINRELESFSYSVSHDLRAPLRSVEAFSNKLLNESDGKLDDQSRDYLLRIQKAGKKMGLLIEDMLKLARISRIEIKPVCIDISEIAQVISNELLESDQSRKANITIAPNINACADRNLITIVLQNLLDNAWKYTRKKEHTSIEFGTTVKEGNIIYYVRDNGVGFDMQFAGTLFKAFQRLHSNSDFEGTGVGLATVQRIIERHRGKIWAESIENKGTAFYFTLFHKVRENKNKML